jgi:uncharacterized membrane protein YhdT
MVLALIKAAQVAPTVFDSLADYPQWFVVACVTIVAAVLIWLVVKVLKWTLWLLLITVLLVGGAAVVGLLLR